jgi:hypothetical protein
MRDDADATTFVVRVIRHPGSASYCRITDVYASRSWVLSDRDDVEALRELLAKWEG